MSLISDILNPAPDIVWKALADSTRRQILESLSNEPVTTGEIVEQFTPTLVRTAVMKHLDVLAGAGLIRVERRGRQRWNHIESKTLKPVTEWLDRHVHNHQRNLKRLKRLTESK